MQQDLKSDTVSPFFDILSNAEEIQIREIEEELKEGRRTFQVRVRTSETKPLAAKLSVEKMSRDYLLQSASLLVQCKDYLLARNVYSFLLKENIRDGEALKGLGICFLRMGNGVSARKCFRAYYELFNDEEGLFWLGLSETIQNNDVEAAKYFADVKHPEFLKQDLQFEFFKEAGNVFIRVNKTKDAEDSYRKALNINPHSDAVYVNLGTLCTQEKRYEAAHSHFIKAISLNPTNARAYCGLGMAYTGMGQTKDAIKQFEKALDVDPSNFIAISQLVKITNGQEELKSLRERLIRFLNTEKKNSDVRYFLAVCEFRQGNYLGCQREVETVLKENPNHENAARLREELVKHLQSTGGSL